jgi:hypothetical protein
MKIADYRLQVARALAKEPADAAAEGEAMNNALRMLAKVRSLSIAAYVLKHNGLAVREGPFAGMEYNDHSTEGCHIAKLLGVYEQPLHATIKSLFAPEIRTVLNVGSAEGYYAVGFARSMPWARIVARDADPKAPVQVEALAAKNGVADRVITAGRIAHEGFAEFDDGATLLVCDIEGGEAELLDPVAATALTRMRILVESHEVLQPGVTKMLADRFAPSHQIKLVEDNGLRAVHEPPPWFKRMAHLDQLLAVWEWRTGPTPWLVMTPKGG